MNILGLVQQVRRITNKSSVSTDDNFLSESDCSFYIKDAAGDIQIRYPAFTEFIVTGTNITPDPDTIDERLLVWGASCLLMIDDEITASGDAIAIKAGPISLDTSKSVRGLSESSKKVCNTFDKMIENVLIHGKAGASIGGSRIDTYQETLGDNLDPDRLL